MSTDSLLPERIGGFVAMAMLGHLSPHDRRALWSTLAARLAPDAPAVVHLQPPPRPVAMPLTRHTAVRLGDLDYEGWNEAEPAGERELQWTMTYRVVRDGNLLDERRWTSAFHTVSANDVHAEASAAGLDATTGTLGLVVLRRRG